MPSRPRDRSKAATKNSKGESGIDFGLEMAQRVTVRERIDPAITASLFANYRSSADAVMELVDNAIDSRLKGSALNVLLQVHALVLCHRDSGRRGDGAGRARTPLPALGRITQAGTQPAGPVRSRRQSCDWPSGHELHRRSQPTG